MALLFVLFLNLMKPEQVKLAWSHREVPTQVSCVCVNPDITCSSTG